MPAEIGVRQATAEEARILQALLQCKLLPAHTADLQFVIGIYSDAQQRLDVMTPGRESYLWRIAYRYREALPKELQSMIRDRVKEERAKKMASSASRTSSA
jgi:hypothetical protein